MLRIESKVKVEMFKEAMKAFVAFNKIELSQTSRQAPSEETWKIEMTKWSGHSEERRVAGDPEDLFSDDKNSLEPEKPHVEVLKPVLLKRLGKIKAEKSSLAEDEFYDVPNSLED